MYTFWNHDDGGGCWVPAMPLGEASHFYLEIFNPLKVRLQHTKPEVSRSFPRPKTLTGLGGGRTYCYLAMSLEHDKTIGSKYWIANRSFLPMPSGVGRDIPSY